MQINKFTIISLLALTPILAQAAIYKWVDAEGNVQYSSEQPKDTEAEKMRVNTQPPIDRSTYKRPGQASDKSDDSAKTDATEDKDKSPADKRADATKKAESDKIRKEMCAEARKTLQTIEDNARVRIEDDKGNITYLSEAEIAARKKTEQGRVTKYCK
jgi:hypothetical protein